MTESPRQMTPLEFFFFSLRGREKERKKEKERKERKEREKKMAPLPLFSSSLTVAVEDEGVDRVDELLAVVDRGAADC